MRYLICYDVTTDTPADQRRLRAVAKICEAFGHRVQYSVFEAELDKAGVLLLTTALTETMDMDRDSVDVYALRNTPGASKHFGRQRDFDSNDPLVL